MLRVQWLRTAVSLEACVQFSFTNNNTRHIIVTQISFLVWHSLVHFVFSFVSSFRSGFVNLQVVYFPFGTMQSCVLFSIARILCSCECVSIRVSSVRVAMSLNRSIKGRCPQQLHPPQCRENSTTRKLTADPLDSTPSLMSQVFSHWHDSLCTVTYGFCIICFDHSWQWHPLNQTRHKSLNGVRLLCLYLATAGSRRRCAKRHSACGAEQGRAEVREIVFPRLLTVRTVWPLKVIFKHN